MSISAPFIRRPIATSLLMLGTLVFGIVAYSMLPVAALPNVDFPTITVTVQYPGASPDVRVVGRGPLEQQFASLPSLDQMTSFSGIGVTVITMQFALDRNIDGAAQDVQQAISAASGLLPKDLPSPPTYKKTNPADFPVLIYAVHSDTLPVYRIDDYAYVILAQKMSTVPGVGQVGVFGQKQYAVRIQVDAAQLASLGLGLEDVRTAIANATVDRPKGNIENSFQSVTLDTNDQMFDAAGFRQLVIAYRHGAAITLGDIANVTDSVQNDRVGGWYDGEPAEGLAIQRAAGANTIQVVESAKGLLPHTWSIGAAGPPCRPDVGSLAGDPRRGPRRPVHDGADDRARRAGDLHLPAHAVGDRDPQHRRAAVAADDVLGDVCAELQPRQHLADGADDLGRVHRRRRDRDDRERRALSGDGRLAVRGGAEGGGADRVHDHLDHLLADCRVHPLLLMGSSGNSPASSR